MIRALLIIAALAFLAVPAAAESPAALKAFIPKEARAVVGLDLNPGAYAAFGSLASDYMGRDAGAARLLRWVEAAKLEASPSAALIIEGDRGEVATVLRYAELRDSHWLRLEALMEIEGLTPGEGRGAVLWSAGGEAAESIPEDLAVARLNQAVLAVGDVALVKAIADAAQKKRGIPGRLGSMLEQVPLLSTAWFVALPPEGGGGCQEGVSGHVVLDDGLLVELRWQCAGQEAARVWRDELKAAAGEAGLGRELADKPRLLALVRGALIHRVGEDVMLVATAAEETVRAILGEVSLKTLPAFDSP